MEGNCIFKNELSQKLLMHECGRNIERSTADSWGIKWKFLNWLRGVKCGSERRLLGGIDRKCLSQDFTEHLWEFGEKKFA